MTRRFGVFERWQFKGEYGERLGIEETGSVWDALCSAVDHYMLTVLKCRTVDEANKHPHVVYIHDDGSCGDYRIENGKDWVFVQVTELE